MRYIVIAAIGAALTAYGFSSGVNLPHSLGYVLGWLGVAISVGGAYFQYRASFPHEQQLLEQTWNKEEGGFAIRIPLAVHRKGHGAGIDVLMKTPNGFEQVECDKEVLSDGTVYVFVSTRIVGKVVVR